ncbi:DUF4231 domain-containing protein [uncultured Ruegeria sp.]|uniref:DUF4231 domain-containing protein n=1 Tax=uncultured Ruegeria sp. TaxID=259304 RepID=UPI0026058A82|nr:DUF4231 domain-containing protein [uncultured Ruegeria sp.]
MVAESVPNSKDDSGYQRLENQIVWYDNRIATAQRIYRILEVVQIVIAAAIPVASLIRLGSAVVGSAGGVAVVGGVTASLRVFRSVR